MKSIDDAQFHKLISALLSHSPAGRRDRVLLQTMFDSGLRCAEACALLPGDIEFRAADDCWIHVRHGKGTSEAAASEDDDGIGSERYVPIDGELASSLGAWLEDPDRPRLNDAFTEPGFHGEREAFVFPVMTSRPGSRPSVKRPKGTRPTYRGDRLKTRQVRSRMERLSREAGVFISSRDPRDRTRFKTTTVTPHALRHSYAIRLLKNKTLLPVVQQQLGHKDMTTTQKYLRFADSDRADQARAAIEAARNHDDVLRRQRIENQEREGYGLDVFAALSPELRGALAGVIKELDADELLNRLKTS